jgi:hypothetical protein
MPGPPPNPNARRTNDKDAWRTLPAACARPVPAWPIKGRKPAGLVELWRHLWSLPIAEIWHEQNAVRLVARYAQLVIALDDVLAGTSKLGATAAAGLPGEIRQIEDRLLISPSTRIRARIVIAEPAPPATGTAPARAKGVAHLDDYRDIGIA